MLYIETKTGKKYKCERYNYVVQNIKFNRKNSVIVYNVLSSEAPFYSIYTGPESVSISVSLLFYSKDDFNQTLSNVKEIANLEEPIRFVDEINTKISRQLKFTTYYFIRNADWVAKEDDTIELTLDLEPYINTQELKIYAQQFGDSELGEKLYSYALSQGYIGIY